MTKSSLIIMKISHGFSILTVLGTTFSRDSFEKNLKL